MTSTTSSAGEDEQPTFVSGVRPDALTERHSRYDDALSQMGKLADAYVEASVFAEYHLFKAQGTLEAQKHDLTLFSRFLAGIGITRSPEALFIDAHAWAGMTASLLVTFRKWLLEPPASQPGERVLGYSIGSVKRRMSTVRQYCKLAFQSGTIAPDEWTRIKAVAAPSHAEGANLDAGRERKRIATRITSRKERPTPLTRSDFHQLRSTTTARASHREHDVILSERDSLLVCLLGQHGLRVSEVVALNVGSLDLRMNQLAIVRSKTHESDILPLLPATRRAAELYLPLVHADRSKPLFTGYQGRRITRQGIYERIKDLGQLIDVPHLSPHDLRHFFAKNGIEQGNPLNVLQRYGGWKSGHMPLWYAKQYGAAAAILKTGFEGEEEEES